MGWGRPWRAYQWSRHTSVSWPTHSEMASIATGPRAMPASSSFRSSGVIMAATAALGENSVDATGWSGG